MAPPPAQAINQSLRALGLALVIFGLMTMIATCIECGILGLGGVAIGLSLYLIGYIAAKPAWGFYPRAVGIILLVAVVMTAGVLTNRAVRASSKAVRARVAIARAQADTRAVASAIRDFSAHCGGLPVGGTSNTTNCTATTAAPSGPVQIPSVLLTPQTNARGEVRGPFIRAMPTLPNGWKGSDNSYSYYTFPTGGFTVCATGDGTGANSDGGTTCP